MRFATFENGHGRERLGFVISTGEIADLETAFAAKLSAEMPREKACELAAALAPPEILSFIEGGTRCMEAARQASFFLEAAISEQNVIHGPSGEELLFRRDEVLLKAPVPRPPKIICAGKNFADHSKEMASRGGNIPTHPVAFAKVPSAVIGPDGRIPYPKETEKLDYEVEVAVIIGKDCRNIRREDAYDYVFGYTAFNDLSARDVAIAENVRGVFLLGKNFPGFAPLGPYLVTGDEIGDPQSLRLQCRVNGETRQDSSLRMMIFKIDEMVAFWSQVGLEPGDILTTGTPSGVAAGRKAGQSPWWLKKGDVVESEVERLGILKSYII